MTSTTRRTRPRAGWRSRAGRSGPAPHRPQVAARAAPAPSPDASRHDPPIGRLRDHGGLSRDPAQQAIPRQAAPRSRCRTRHRRRASRSAVKLGLGRSVGERGRRPSARVGGPVELGLGRAVDLADVAPGVRIARGGPFAIVLNRARGLARRAYPGAMSVERQRSARHDDGRSGRRPSSVAAGSPTSGPVGHERVAARALR